ncbi:SDR family NAD(P)-dependent oxidoreductase [Ochrovirga pacifica]|uniref:SDR family NAD(P)-dependent oxidoreductase n=1 Tax=Ochrovirga pacifica TaxID=1042376 RepID=UPI0002FA4E4E|nr:SDR family NAD(P)-dependent oxidoreductase [Ochrovirga pacifica]
MKKNVLITGTSTGVGLETALLFAQNGYKVFATMRNLKKASALKKSRRRSKTRHRTL